MAGRTRTASRWSAGAPDRRRELWASRPTLPFAARCPDNVLSPEADALDPRQLRAPGGGLRPTGRSPSTRVSPIAPPGHQPRSLADPWRGYLAHPPAPHAQCDEVAVARAPHRK